MAILHVVYDFNAGTGRGVGSIQFKHIVLPITSATLLRWREIIADGLRTDGYSDPSVLILNWHELGE